jgi:Transposase DDE domain
MMEIKLKDERLNKRWLFLVRSQMKVSSSLAAGVGGLPTVSAAFSATQAAWRFYSNDRIEFQELVVPLREHAHEQATSSQSAFVLVAHDWSKLSFPGQSSRCDMVELSSETDIGYEAMVSLAINADDGGPIAPVEMHLKTKNGILSTRVGKVRNLNHLDQVLPTMKASLDWNLGKPILHVIDREVDSVSHYREWDSEGHKFLVRSDDRRTLFNGEPMKLSEIRSEVEAQGGFQAVGPAKYHGRVAQLEVAEVAVVLHIAGRKRAPEKRIIVPGKPLSLRLIMTRIVDDKGKQLASWYLLSNAPHEWADTAKIAKCYYWRWRIESFFKLLKSHGFQLENWLQEKADAILRRILTVSMAAVTVWQLMADESEQATELKQMLVRMSGRQTKRSQPFTAPALLAGLCSLLTMIATLEKYDLNALKALVKKINLPVTLLNSG